MDIIFGFLLIAHGLVHSLYFTPQPDDPGYPFNFEKGWLTRAMGEGAIAIGALLTVVVVVFLFLAGLGVMGIPGLDAVWRCFTIFGASASLLTFILFWHRWLVVGALINVVLLYIVLQLDWLFF